VPSDSLHFPGHSKLTQKIIKEISLKGPLTFARFMELALYDEQYGYYMTPMPGDEASSRERIGWEGDFYTAPELSPILAKTLVSQVLEIDAQLGHPDPFIFLEMGGGNGIFASDFLLHCQMTAPDFLNRLSYHLVERSPFLRSRQESSLRKAMGAWIDRHVAWKPSVEQCDSDSVTGVMFANELVDAFPVHRVRFDNQHFQEVFVDYKGGQFVERLGPLSSEKLDEYIDRYGVALGEGQTSELHVQAENWMVHIGRILQRGIVITIDYGHTSSDYYATERKTGTLLCYYKHSVSSNTYSRIGEQDITSHVNFTALAKSGKECGLQLVGFTTLANWLMGLGVEECVQDKDQESKEVQALMQLLRPNGMGTTFKVLVQKKGIEFEALQGLRYRAFFDDVLS
jgi:SAM-dependent MidA family methyltransferase